MWPLQEIVTYPQTFVRPLVLHFRSYIFLLILAFSTGGSLRAQNSPENGSDPSSGEQGASTGNSQGNQTDVAPARSDSATQDQWPGHIPLPAATPAPDSSEQVAPPSVVLPTPALPPLTNSFPEPTPAPSPEQSATPLPTPQPVFNPPTAQNQNLPSALPAGNPFSAPASVAMPNLRLDDATSTGPGALGGMFDWARKLRFQSGVRIGYDNNINSANGTSVVMVNQQVQVQVPVVVLVTNNQVLINGRPEVKPVVTTASVLTNVVSTQTNGAPIIASEFVNLNGGVNYRFGAPRLSVNLDLAGGVTRYLKSDIAQPLQGTLGLGMEINYRFNPRMIFTFNSSSSYQQQPNLTLIGAANNSGNNGYYYTANSFSGAYQWSDLITMITRFDETASYYPNQANQGFNAPSLVQTFRYLVKPTTTAVLDGTANYYGYGNNGNSSLGGVIDAGFDHTFNPKWFWNFRFGGQYQSAQHSTAGSSSYFGPYLDSNFSWVLAKATSINWVAHYSTQPSGQQGSIYTVGLSSGLNYTQGIFTKLTFTLGIFYLLNQYPNTPTGIPGETTSYNQTNIQANTGLSYRLNRIISLSLGYQYLTSTSTSSLGQKYNRDITYLQVGADF